MKIGVIGSGAMACLYACKLSQEKSNQVSLFGSWQENLDAINKNGITMEEDGQEIVFKNVKAYENVDCFDDTVDMAIIFVKGNMTYDALFKYLGITREDTLVLTLQNGVGNIEEISKLILEENVLAGTSAHGATMLGPGKIRHAGTGTTYIGWAHSLDFDQSEGGADENIPMPTFGEKEEDRARTINNIDKVFNKCEIETKIAEDPEGIIWGKLISNVGLNAISAICNVTNGQVVANLIIKDTMKKAVKEAYQVAVAKGIKLSFQDPVLHTETLCKNTAKNRSSMLQDVSNKRLTEIDIINGAIVAEGKKLGIKTPINEDLVNQIKDIEKSYE